MPFFFEPNFDAHISPLDAALRLQAPTYVHSDDKESYSKPATIVYEPVTYGDFLLKKVTNNFTGKSTKGKYD